MDCIYIAHFYTLGASKALYNFASHSPIHTHTYRRRQAAMQGAALPIGSNLGFRALLKDTSAHGLGGVGDRTANLVINRRPPLPRATAAPQTQTCTHLVTNTTNVVLQVPSEVSSTVHSHHLGDCSHRESNSPPLEIGRASCRERV